MKLFFKHSIYIMAIALFSILFTGCSNTNEEKTYTTIEELQNKRIGYTISAIQEQITQERFPNAERIPFNGQMDSIAALQAGHIDATMVSYPTAFLCKKNIPELTWIDEPVSDNVAGIGIKKGNNELLIQVNACLDILKKEGTLDDMVNRWYSMENPDYQMPDILLPTDGKVLVVGVAADREPSTFLSPSGDVIGLDGELVRRIAQYMNCPIEFVDMQMSAFPSALESGKVDMVVSNFIITDELKEVVDFSKPYFSTPFIMLVKKGG